MKTPSAWPARTSIPLETPQLHGPLAELDLPEMIEIEPIHTCNLRCVMCHVSYEKLTHARLDVDVVLKHLQGLEGRYVAVGATHEPAAHPQFSRLVRGLSDLGMKTQITTNGTLLSERIVQEIADCAVDQITISFDGIRKETYERIRRHADYDLAIKRIAHLRRAFYHQPTHFHVNYTLLRSNLDEAREAPEFWDELGFDLLGFIVMVVRNRNELLLGESLSSCMPLVHEKLEEVARTVIERDLRIIVSSASYQRAFPLKEQWPGNFFSNLVLSNNPAARLICHPRSHIQNGAYPGMSVDCRSAFKYARILYNGDVHLCDKFRIGNIHEKSLLEIWHGEEANRIRQLLLQSPTLCHACDYYRFCIKAAQVDYDKEENFFSEGVRALEVSAGLPRLLEADYKGFNVVRYNDRVYGLAHSLGPLDLSAATEAMLQDYQAKKRCFSGRSVQEVKGRIDELLPGEVPAMEAHGLAKWPTSFEEHFKMVARRFEGDSPEERRLRALYEDLAEPVTVAPGAPPEHPVTQTPMEI